MLGEAGWRTFPTNAEAQADYDRALALKTGSLVGFLRETQPEEWAKVEGLYGAHAEERVLARVASELEPHGDRGGAVALMRRGFKMAPEASFRPCYFKPAMAGNADAEARFAANRFELVRQLRFGTLSDGAGST